jgi:hypothetical protein
MESGVPVKAADDMVWAYPSGKLEVGPRPGSNTGSWVVLVPGKKP